MNSGHDHIGAVRQPRLLEAVLLAYTLCVYGPIAAMSIGAGLTGAIWLFTGWGRLREQLRPALRSKLLWPTIVLSVACVWSLVWASLSGLSFYGMKPEISWGQDLRKLWHLVFPFVLTAAFSALPEPALVRTVKLWFWAGVASAVFGITQVFFPIYNPMPLPNEGLRGFFHATGFAGFHLSYASIMAFPMAVCLALTAILSRREGLLSRRTGLAAAVSVLCFAATILSFSKIAWIAMPLTVIFVALIGFRGRARATVVGVIVAFTIAFSLSSAARLRLKGGVGPILDRLKVWEANAAMIKEQPIFGVGWHHNSPLSEAYYRAKQIPEGFVSHAHNAALDQASSTGLFGLVGFLWWCWIPILLSYGLYRANHRLLWRTIGLGFLAGWFCFHLQGLTQSNFWDAKVMHQTGWVVALTLELVRRYGLKRS